ncbi:MAG TPA: hypothetical protein VLG47_06105, partial [Candidatus Saccharimonadales bacterium]|nr:hypothetical protein [Candidatus Saccharimonadales bacterium]
GTGVSMNDADRRKEMRFISEYRKSSEEYGRETLDEMKLLRAEMVAIKSYTSRISRKQTTPLGSGKILEEDTLSGNKSIKDYTEMIE